jgi:hypothetical protein
MSSPLVFGVGCIGIYSVANDLPDAVSNLNWPWIFIDLLTLLVGFACAIPPLVANLQLLHKAAEKILLIAGKALK